MRRDMLKCLSFTLVVLFLAAVPCARAQGPLGDYGDAPDPSFPSLWTSSGPRHLGLLDCWVGWTSTGEPDALISDMDLDDGMPVIFADLTSGIWSGWVYVPITLAATADPMVPRYLNVLLDGNGSGTWCDIAGEWVVRNYQLPSYGMVHNPGETVWYCLGGFTWVTNYSGQRWVRVTLSDSPVTANVPNGWDGSWVPTFAFGETEDWVLTWYYNPNPPPPPDPPVPPIPPYDPSDPDPPQPLPECKKAFTVYQVPPPTHYGHKGGFKVRVKNTNKNHPIHIVYGPYPTDLHGDPVDLGTPSLYSTVLQPGQSVDAGWSWEFERSGENKAWGNLDVIVDPQGVYVVAANLGNYLNATSQQPTGLSIMEIPVPATRGMGLLVLLAALCLTGVIFVFRRRRAPVVG